MTNHSCLMLTNGLQINAGLTKTSLIGAQRLKSKKYMFHAKIGGHTSSLNNLISCKLILYPYCLNKTFSTLVPQSA